MSKLLLSKESVRVLVSSDLSRVNGGYPKAQPTSSVDPTGPKTTLRPTSSARPERHHHHHHKIVPTSTVYKPL